MQVVGISTMEMSPESISISVNEEFLVSITVSPDVEIDTIASDLITYNQTIIECLSIEKGNIMEPLLWIGGTINNNNGTIEEICMATDDPFNGSGTYLILTFKGKKTGNTVISSVEQGLARAGDPVDLDVLNECYVTVTPSEDEEDDDDGGDGGGTGGGGGGYMPPPENDDSQNQGNQENESTNSTNEMNDTEDNSTSNDNSTATPDNSTSENDNSEDNTEETNDENKQDEEYIPNEEENDDADEKSLKILGKSRHRDKTDFEIFIINLQNFIFGIWGLLLSIVSIIILSILLIRKRNERYYGMQKSVEPIVEEEETDDDFDDIFNLD